MFTFNVWRSRLQSLYQVHDTDIEEFIEKRTRFKTDENVYQFNNIGLGTITSQNIKLVEIDQKVCLFALLYKMFYICPLIIGGGS